jgi:TolA-binding protein
MEGNGMRSVLRVGFLGLAVAVLSGCATSGFLGFLATTDYVEREVKEARTQSRSEIRELHQRVDSMQNDVEEMKQVREQLSELVAQVEETRAATEELQRLADDVRTRLDRMPRETIEELTRILQQYLEERSASTE